MKSRNVTDKKQTQPPLIPLTTRFFMPQSTRRAKHAKQVKVARLCKSKGEAKENPCCSVVKVLCSRVQVIVGGAIWFEIGNFRELCSECMCRGMENRSFDQRDIAMLFRFSSKVAIKSRLKRRCLDRFS
jgi:hypothetical protein